jgi:molybdate-binding protein
MSVASGQANAGLGVRAAATALDLGRVRVVWEEVDIVLSGGALPAPRTAHRRAPRPARAGCDRHPRRL